jgi:threonine dehydratase
MTSAPVSLDDAQAAARLVEGRVVRTPTQVSRALSERCGATVVLKYENQQYTSSFKERGAIVKLDSLTAAERAAGVIAMSAGNHAQGVAYHAAAMDIPATIVMPRGTPFTKVRRTEAHGATVVMEGADLSEAAAHARALQAERGLTYVHPYDDPAIIAGQGTIALEMLADDPALEVLVVPIGGGGLISGIATAAKAIKPGIEIIGVEAALYPAMSQVLRGEAPTAGGVTIAEGIAVKDPGKITREVVRRLVDDILLVDETAIENAILALIDTEKTVAEGAGAAGLAAVMTMPERFAGKRAGIVLCGGNIDARLLSAILMRGLVREGQLVQIRVELSDSPGLLADVSRLIAKSGGNIVEVYHQRIFHDVPLKMAELDIVIETRDRRHVDVILQALTEAGMPAQLLSHIDEQPV